MSTVKEEGYKLSPSLLCCRACLATDIKLFNIHRNRLAQALTDITGIPVSPSDGFPQHLCVFCCITLSKIFEFQAKCHRAYVCLSQVPSIQLTIDYIRSVDRTSHELLHNLTLTEIDTTDYGGDKQLEQINKKHNTNTILTSNDLKLELQFEDNVYDECNENTEQIFVATNPLAVKNEEEVQKRENEIKKCKYNLDKQIDEFSDDNTEQIFVATNPLAVKNEEEVQKRENEIKKCKYNLDKQIDEFSDDNTEQIFVATNPLAVKNEEEVQKRENEIIKGKDNVNENIDGLSDGNTEQITVTTNPVPVKKQRKVQKGKNDAKKSKDNLDDHLDNFSDGNTEQITVSKNPVPVKKQRKVQKGKNDSKISKDNLDVHIDDVSDGNTEKISVSTNPVKKQRNVRKRNNENKGTKERKIKRRLSDNDYLPDFDFATYESTYKAEVIFLTKEQQMQEIEARRSSDSYNSAPYKCIPCGKGFQAEGAYDNHLARHSPNAGNHACEVCHVRFKKASRRQKHQDFHRLKIVCKECGFVSRCRDQAKRHYGVHAGKIHSCKHCGATFTKSSTYLSHVRLKHRALNVACDVCGETFVGRLGLMQHKTRAHKVDSTKHEACVSCDAQFKSLEALNRHTESSINGICDTNMRPCLQCGESLSSEEALQSHIKELHPPKRYECLNCHKTFANSWSYGVHYKRVHLKLKSCDKRKVVCEFCGKSFRSNAALVYHQRKHTGEKPYKCSQCTKSFAMLQTLVNHKQMHLEERPYKCAVCPRAYRIKYQLKQHSLGHSLTHTGERPFACDRCPLAFHHSGNLRRHVKIVHLGQRTNTPCPLCGKIFSAPSAVKLHVDTVHHHKPAPRRRPRRKQTKTAAINVPQT